MNLILTSGGLLVLLVLVVASASIRIAKEYERGVVFRLGRLIALRGPGLFFKYPGVDIRASIASPWSICA